MKKRIWVTWETQRRNRTLSAEVGADLFELDYKGGLLARYAHCIFKTLQLFVGTDPKLIFAQNPSIVLALVAVAYGKVVGVPVIIDAHYAGLFPFEGRYRWGNVLAGAIFRLSSMTIVTNGNSRKYVEQLGGKAHVMTDPIPQFAIDEQKPKPLKGKINVLFICTYAKDEPYMEVIDAAKRIERDVCIYVTGKIKGHLTELAKATPDNVVFTNYVPEEEYVELLHSVDVIIDLTTREDCLVCGAYEAVAAGKPLIASDTKAMRAVFSKGVLYTNNTASDIAEKIGVAIQQRDILRQDIVELRKHILDSRKTMHAELDRVLLELER